MYTYSQLISHNWTACSADSAMQILELEVQNSRRERKVGRKWGTKKGHPRTCPRRASNTLFMENISSKKQVPPCRICIRIGFPGGTGGKEPICQCRRHRDVGLLPGLGRFPGGGNGNPPGILSWGILWTEKSGGLQPIGSQKKSATTEAT